MAAEAARIRAVMTAGLREFGQQVAQRHYRSAAGRRSADDTLRRLMEHIGATAGPAALFTDAGVAAVRQTIADLPRDRYPYLRHLVRDALAHHHIAPGLVPHSQRLFALLHNRPRQSSRATGWPEAITAYGGREPSAEDMRVRRAVARFWKWLRADLSTLTTADLRRWQLEKLASLTTCNHRHELAEIKKWLRWAIARGYVRTSVSVDLLRLPPNPRTRRERWLTRDETVAVLGAALSLPRLPYLTFAVFSLMAATGARLIAVRTLRWTMVRINPDGTWSIPCRPKTQTYYRLLPPAASAALRLHASVSLDSDWMFPFEDGQPISDHFLRRQFHHCLRLAGVARDVGGPHVLRHTHATLLAEHGSPPREIMQRLGLSTYSTLDVYAHATPQSQDSAVQRLDLESQKEGHK